MFAYFTLLPEEPSAEQVELLGVDEYYQMHGGRYSRIAKTLLSLYGLTRPEYQHVNKCCEAANYPDGRYNYNRQSNVLRSYCMTEDDELYGIPCANHSTVIFVNLDELPDRHYLDEVAYLLDTEPTIVDTALDWDTTKIRSDS